jgi:hypothetical protein
MLGHIAHDGARDRHHIAPAALQSSKVLAAELLDDIFLFKIRNFFLFFSI